MVTKGETTYLKICALQSKSDGERNRDHHMKKLSFYLILIKRKVTSVVANFRPQWHPNLHMYGGYTSLNMIHIGMDLRGCPPCSTQYSALHN
jgi:hypothetical protein